MVLPLIVTSVVTGTGSSQLRVRNRLADELGFYLPTTVSTLATNADAARVVIANEVRDDEAGYPFLGDPWLYVRDGAQAGVQRRVIRQPEVGYQGPRGVLLVSRPFAAALAPGTTVEITSPLPVLRHVGIKGLNECVNEALSMIRVAARLTVTGNGTYEYDLAAYSWLTHEDQIVGISDSDIGTGYPALPSPYIPSLVTNGVSRTLVTRTSYSTAETFALDVVVPADRLVYDGTGWAFVPAGSPPGLLGDTYQTAAPESWVLAFAMVTALRQVGKLIRAQRGADPGEKADALAENARLRRKWALTAFGIQQQEMPRNRAATPEPLIAGAGPDPVWT